jgi:hypothetical protein
LSPSLLETFWANPTIRPQWTGPEWESVLGQARVTRLLGRLAAHFADQGWVPENRKGPYLHLESGLRLTERQQHEVRWEVSRIAHALRNQSTPVVLLKGAAYLMAELPAARGRLFSDIDILVPHPQIGVVEGSLFAAGWISDERDAYNQRYYRQWMHEIPPLRHIQRNTFIDLHHTVTPPTSRFNVDGARLLEGIRPVAGHANIFVLAPVDMVLHSAVHLFTEGEFYAGLRDLLDLNDLVHHFAQQAGFWDSLLQRAAELGLGIPLFHALYHLERLFGTSAPAHLSQRVSDLGPNPWSKWFMAWALGLALRPAHPSCEAGGFVGLARWLLYVRSHALRMPLRLVVPHLVRKAWMRSFPEKSEPINA